MNKVWFLVNNNGSNRFIICDKQNILMQTLITKILSEGDIGILCIIFTTFLHKYRSLLKCKMSVKKQTKASFFLLCFSFSTLLWLSGFFCLHSNCKKFCSNSVKNVIVNLIGIALNLQTAVGNIFMFIILILPIQEHGIFLHLFMSSLISFISIFQFF